jgi:hypothetical protein
VDTVTIAALGFAALVLFIVLAQAWLARARRNARSARAVRGECEAATLLRSCGYAIVKSQASIQYPVEVDGQTVLAGLRADYIVSKNGARYVAEVKTGEIAPSVRAAATRRQLLEYELAFGVDGVLLVDGERGVVHAVAFPTLMRRERR